MKKRSLLMLISGMLFMSGSLVSCSDSEEADKVNTLKVDPSSTIQFAASNNEDVVLTVTTDASSWEVGEKPTWVTATKSDRTLVVNVQDNTSGGTRSNRIEIKAGNAQPIFINISQSKPAEGDDNVLSVTPSENIVFNASGNADIVLTVATDAADWTFEKPEWMTATKAGDKLTVNAQKNETGGSRAGRLTVSAGTAKSVIVNVSQKAAGDEPDPTKIAGTLKDESGKSEVKFEGINVKETPSLTANVEFALATAATGAASVEVFMDEAYLAEYNFINKTSCKIFPKALAAIANSGNIAFVASEKSKKLAITLDVSSDQLLFGESYLIPLYVKVKSGNVSVANETCRVNYIVKKKNPKEVKNVLFFEVNDTNPLNALEYKLADGTMFFDAIILFAANINYKSGEDLVYLNNNPNVQALLDGSETFLQPLRKAGIKVYLGLLGNHDAAGLCQLSDWGSQQFGQELALAVDQYKLDGVNFDDEYSVYPISGNKWFTSPSAAAGSRLCYETKKALKETVSWETEVSYFEWGRFYDAPAVDGHQPVEFIDFTVANYGGATSPLGGQTLKHCSGMSIECNGGTGYISESSARSIKANGYGYVMWFAFEPVGKQMGSGTISSNLTRSLGMMQGAAKGLYDQELPAPTGYYKKTGEGAYDSKRYTF